MPWWVERGSGLLPSLGTRFLLASLPRTAVKGSHISPLGGGGGIAPKHLRYEFEACGYRCFVGIINREGR